MPSATKSISGIELRSEIGLSIVEPQWHAWFFETRVLPTVTKYALTGEEINAEFVSELIAPHWHAWFFEPRGLPATSSVNYSAIGIEVGSYYGETTVIGTAGAEVDAIELTSEYGQINVYAVIDALAEIFGQDVSAEAGIVDAYGIISIPAFAEIFGQEVASEFGSVDVEISAPAAIDGLASINGKDVTIEIASIGISTADPVIYVPTMPKRYSADTKQNANAEISGINVSAEIGAITAGGKIKIDAAAKCTSIIIEAKFAKINADGIAGISEDEFLLLMAA